MPNLERNASDSCSVTLIVRKFENGFELPSYDPVEFLNFDVKWQTNGPAETQYLAIQPVAEANIAIQKPQEQPQSVAEVQHGEPSQAPNDGQQQEAQLANSR